MNHFSKALVDISLRRYIEIVIIDKYKRFDRAHDLTHVSNVIKNSFEICSYLNQNIDQSMVYTIAAYHDIGLLYGRENHEKTSAQYLLKDIKLKNWFTNSQIIEMAEAIEDHRASSKREPRNLYGKIIADADRDINYLTVLTRTINYGLFNYPNYNKKQHWIRTRTHLDEKYSNNGYLTLWLDCAFNNKRLQELHEQIQNKQFMYRDFRSIFSVEEVKVNNKANNRLLSLFNENLLIRLLFQR